MSGRRVLSLAPLLLGTLTHVTAVSGVVWKDAQLAVALLAAVVLLLYRSRLRSAAVATVVLLLAYAGAVRNNALSAIVPLLFLLTWPGVRRPRRTRALLVGAAVVGVRAANPLGGTVRPVAETHLAAGVMLDDAPHLDSRDELRSADVLVALVVSGVAWRRHGSASHSGVALALGLSAAAYVLAYLPVVIGYDYRFVYWPAVEVSGAAVLLLLDCRVRDDEAATPGPEGGGPTLPPASPAPGDRVVPAGPPGAVAPARPSSPGSTS